MVRKTLESLEPVGRFGQAEEVARLALFLAGDDSSFCTGAPFVVDGAWWRRSGMRCGRKPTDRAKETFTARRMSV